MGKAKSHMNYIQKLMMFTFGSKIQFLLTVRFLNDLSEIQNCDLATVCLCKKTCCQASFMLCQSKFEVFRHDLSYIQGKESLGIKLFQRKFSHQSVQPSFECERKWNLGLLYSLRVTYFNITEQKIGHGVSVKVG